LPRLLHRRRRDQEKPKILLVSFLLFMNPFEVAMIRYEQCPKSGHGSLAAPFSQEEKT
jgi:hypothetical protein